MVSRFFIERPVFAWVFAIVIMLAGLLGLRHLSVAQYPNIAPPIVQVSAFYPGASAEVVENSVTQILEQELKGLDHLLYFDANSSSSGSASITLVFEQDADPEVAQVQVQNKVNQVSYRLPRAVQQAGLSVTAQQGSFLMVAVFYDESGVRSDADISDWLATTMVDALARVPGVGAVENFGSPYAMRIWLQPHRLSSFGLIPADVVRAIESQNTEVPVGELGGRPSDNEQRLNVTVTALSRLQTPEQFRDIVIKTAPDGAVVRLADVARVEIGSESYASTSRLNGMPASGLAINLAPGANALDTAGLVKERIEQMKPAFPQGVKMMYPEDATRFVKRSITEVIKTLVEAMALVVLVMFIFLQNWRSTLIPAIALPVVLLGTFAVLAACGYSINTLTLFGMVLAIGLLVDDAIVVVENVERIMAEEGLDARAATIKSMSEITSALVGITLVLGAVFLPMAFFAGSVGVIYRQFSVTLVSAMALSVLVAVSLTPVLCASLLKPHADKDYSKTRRYGLLAAIGRGINNVQQKYTRSLSLVLNRPVRFLVVYAAILLCVFFGYQRLPGAFIPEDDQGTVMVRYMLPAGATYPRTAEVVKEIEQYFLTQEKENVEAIYTVAGFSFTGSGQNAGIGFVPLKDWSERKGFENSAQAIASRATRALSGLRDAKVFAMVLPPIDGLGDTDGFEFWLQDTQAIGQAKLAEKARELVDAASESPAILYADSDGSEPSPQLRIDIDQQKASALGLDLDDVNSTLGTAWGGTYVNDFVHRGRVKKVLMQADADYRSAPEDLHQWFVRGNDDAMTPFSAFASTRWDSGPTQLTRFNGLPAIPISGAGVPGVSSGEVMEEIERIAAEQGVTHFAWSGLSYQEKISSGQAPLLYAVSILFVFLCLAALYESWSIPFSVLMVIPLGLLGAVLGANLLGMTRDIFFQVGVLTTIGLSAKNAILIVEFAEHAMRQGQGVMQAIIAGASQRLRPIVMTSLAFGAGVVPLVLATGPGAAGQNAIGASVLGGVVSATVCVIFLVPLCYLLIVRATEKLQRRFNNRATTARDFSEGGAA
ncbi:MAG: multidrug efflux RND transporter permease subunit [Cellvibrio sp.]|uniref:multidrug efflux RND transporter permease subunit n=1 Tax=Cellvibrio sp. TaxID=1965322 RepID=UPI0031A400A7